MRTRKSKEEHERAEESSRWKMKTEEYIVKESKVEWKGKREAIRGIK